MKETIAIAHPNFALVKYWGKKDSDQNRPAMSSISITVDSMQSKTRIVSDEAEYVGRGADTDIIVASAKAYMNALNRLLSIGV